MALGYKDFRSYFGDPALCGKSIGRVAGCIAYGTMRIDGEEYRLDINGMAGHLNGGVKGFAGRNFVNAFWGDFAAFSPEYSKKCHDFFRTMGYNE